MRRVFGCCLLMLGVLGLQMRVANATTVCVSTTNDIWCDSQREPVMVTACRIDNDAATIEVRGWKSTGRIGMTRHEAKWQVDSETYQPQRLAARRAEITPSGPGGPRLE